MRKVQINTKELSISKRQNRKRHVWKYEAFMNLVMDREALEFTDYKKAKAMYNCAFQRVKYLKDQGKILDYKVAMKSRGKLIYVFKKSTRKPNV